ncbi:alpha/beta hydrolase fold-3 domain-containing protein [Actinosynnema mirum DSM] [Mycolicibacterium parafortuitum]|uniref:Alpha/beta hydrolase fold-3 domain-containing protein [Actinosynnema mirum DSM] n=1 Tax=Mycolicibacterium parafortuitum TaxID=39692 RepID=A0A375YHL1_MYCPF|nr:alpha/beta hydrolase fold-3 domain-containing protein [Actinosynnema mirum DSM] [Mycolicibacterium parafortuitum]
MSILSRPPVADAIARLFSRAVDPAPRPEVTFPDVPGDRTTGIVTTRHGPAPVTVYRPPENVGRAAVYVNVHGGGFVVGHPEQDDPWCRYLAARAGVVVVNVDYVLAPGHRFPAAAQQLLDVARWAADPGRDWDGGRLCIGGQSAGGNLSAAVCRMALDEGGPPIALQVLHYAPLDLVTPTSRKSSPLGSRAILKPWMGEVFDSAYIPARGDRSHRLASPAWGSNADGIDGIAPALVITAQYDRLRDEGVRYAAKLADAGSLVHHYDVEGVDHGYNIMSGDVEVTRRMYDVIVAAVRRATTPGP